MSFGEMLANDAAIFVDADLMPGVETVTYKPKNGASRSVSATVYRGEPSDVPGAPAGAGTIRVFIRNHATLGATGIDCGGDKISIPPREGGTPIDHQIVEVIKQDPGGWMLKLRGRAS